MAKLIERSIKFFKDETVFSISLILSLISCFFVKPSSNYLNYINWNTIILLLVMMILVEILKNLSVFEILLRRILVKIGNTRELLIILVFICFLSSIFITNDISLIIFVPFSIMALKKINRSDLIIVTVCLQTIASNIGCMLLPTGAPHNIVLYTTYHISLESFLLILLPYIIISVIFIMSIILLIPVDDINFIHMSKIQVYKSHFLKRVLFNIDYYLILTFIALFILIGNLGNIPFFNLLFKKWIIGNEVFSGFIISQFISNVPAAILLSGFSSNIKDVIVGINIGGFGTLIASMANLISYNILIREYHELKVRYLIIFTVLNFALAIILLIVNALI